MSEVEDHILARRAAMAVLQDLVRTHVDLGRRAKTLLALLECDGANEPEILTDLEKVTTLMERLDLQIREGEKLLGVNLAPPGSNATH